MIQAIVAMDQHDVIGNDGQMPWHLPNDLKHFKSVTTGHTIIMGRKTFESIGRPLPNRKNVVVTRNRDFRHDGVEVLHDLEQIPELYGEEDAFIIGGGELYKALIHAIERLYVTRIHDTFDGDTMFPALDWNEWELIEETKGVLDEKNTVPHTFFVFERKMT